MPIVAKTLRSTVADGEILKVEKLGSPSLEIFCRLAGSDAPVSRLFPWKWQAITPGKMDGISGSKRLSPSSAAAR